MLFACFILAQSEICSSRRFNSLDLLSSSQSNASVSANNVIRKALCVDVNKENANYEKDSSSTLDDVVVEHHIFATIFGLIRIMVCTREFSIWLDGRCPGAF